MLRMLILLILVAPSIVSAVVTVDGLEFSENFGAEGTILKSKLTSILLKKDCTAISRKYGKGFWEWSNAGFMIIFKQQTLTFPHQEIEVKDENCRA